MRFTHANRHCPDHPYATLTRSDDFVLKPVSENTELPHDVTRWLERYKMSREREDRTPTGKNERKKSWKSTAENHKRVKSRKGLMMDTAGEQENLNSELSTQQLYCEESQDSQEESQDEDPMEICTILQTSEDEEIPNTKLTVTSLRRPLDRLQPKKRWLREARREQQLAKPLNWDVRSNGVTSIHKIDEKHSVSNFKESSLLQWNVPDVDNPINNNTSALNMHDKLTIPNARLNSSLVSNQVCWDINLNNKSTKTVTIKRENAYEIDHALKQSQCDASLYDHLPNNIPDLETSVGHSIKIQNTELTHLHVRNLLPSEVSTSLQQIASNSKQYIHEEIVNPDIVAIPSISENKTRPTVLMLAGNSNNINSNDIISKTGKDISPTLSDANKTLSDIEIVVKEDDNTIKLPIQEDNKKWIGALALMELAKTQKEATKVLEHKDNVKDKSIASSKLNYSHL